MKLTFVIAALFAASAIAAPCGKTHVEQVVDSVDSPILDDPSAPTDAPIVDSTGSDVTDTTGPEDLTLNDTPATSDNNSDQENDGKTTETITSNEQTAVINSKSGEKGGKGSLFNFDTSNFVEDGLFDHASNSISQHNH